MLGLKLQFCFSLIIFYHISYIDSIAQNYFKVSENSDIYFNQLVARFPNNDILIGDSSLEPLMTSRGDGKVVMSRMDQCGNRIWSYSYSLGFAYLEFRDFVISDTDNILAYGSYFNGTEEFLFLLKVNGETGRNAIFHTYDPETINGYFAYSLEVIDNQFLVYGFLINPNVGFMALFDEALNPIWAKKISPFQANGAALVTENKNIFSRSGNYLFMMSSIGDVNWASVSNISIVNGPIETTTGLLFEGHQEGLSTIYKINQEGQLLWQSLPFNTVETSSAISVLSNDEILVSYNCPYELENKFCQLILSPSGLIQEQRYLSQDRDLNTGILSQTISDNEIITIAANANSFVAGNKEKKDFIFQYSTKDQNNNCISWEVFQDTFNNHISLNFDLVELNSEDFDLQLIERTEAFIDTFLFPLNDLCEQQTEPERIPRDTLLSCGENWSVNLPDDTFFWEDGIDANPRVLEAAGIYNAKNVNCENQIILEFQLNKTDCDCNWYLPNAFRPNNNGINDEFGLFSDCNFIDFKMYIFNRWGELVFQSNNSDQFWNGRYKQKDSPMGIYVACVQFEWIDSNGQTYEETHYQDITLVR